MAQPGMFAPRGEDWIGREITDIKRQMREQAAANVFGSSGITPRKGGTDFEGFVNVNGPLTINGDAEITGALSLPAGIINNDALASPLQTATAANGVNNYAISTTSTVRVSVSLAVPEGFTEAIVIANPTAMGHNGTATPDYLYVQAVVQTVNGGELYSSAPNGLGAGLAAPFHTTLTGLTAGASITVGVATRAGFNAWPASTANQANIYATAIFLR